MKTKKELLEEATFEGNWQTISGAKATSLTKTGDEK
jgi:hypothetical protein